MKVSNRSLRPIKILKNCLLVGLLASTVSICQAGISIGLGVFPQPYPVYYQPYQPYAAPCMEPEWIPGHWYRGYWIPGHYADYGYPYGYGPGPVIMPGPVIAPGPGFIYYHGGGCHHRHHCW